MYSLIRINWQIKLFLSTRRKIRGFHKLCLRTPRLNLSIHDAIILNRKGRGLFSIADIRFGESAMHSGLIKFFAGLLFGLTSTCVVQAQATSADYDLIIRGGTVFDGTGGEG